MARVDARNFVAAEQALLGAAMFDNAAWREIGGRIDSVDFERRDHQIIFSAIADLAAQSKPFDAVTLSEWLERKGLSDQTGGLAYLASLVRDTPSAANVKAYAEIVRERSLLRQLQRVGRELNLATDESGSASDAISSAVAKILRLQQRTRTGAGLVDAKRLTGELIDDLDRRRETPMGLSVGLSDFDALTSGLEPGDLVVIAGRPGMGKTALLVAVAAHVSQSAGVAVFSAEMPRTQLMRRCVATLSNIPQGLLRRADKLTAEQWAAMAPAMRATAARHLWIDDAPAPTLSHVRAELTALHARERLSLCIVDYLQLLRGSGANRYEQLREVAYGLKALAKDLAIPIIALAQLNRGVETREHKRPGTSDLRDSGAIEEAADIIGLMYSEGYYDSSFAMPYVLECSIAKNRNGERGECFWRFNGALSRITVLEDAARAQYRRLLAKEKSRRGMDL